MIYKPCFQGVKLASVDAVKIIQFPSYETSIELIFCISWSERQGIKFIIEFIRLRAVMSAKKGESSYIS